MDAISGALTTAGGAISGALSAVSGVISPIGNVVQGTARTTVAFIAGSPVPVVYARFFGDTSIYVFLREWLPLGLSTILPILCLLFVLVGACGKSQPRPVGHRIVRRVGLIVQADVRMVQRVRSKKKTTPKDVESGRKVSPAKGKAEERAIKQKAAGGKGGRFY